MWIRLTALRCRFLHTTCACPAVAAAAAAAAVRFCCLQLQFCGKIEEMKARCGELMSAGCSGFTYDAYTTCGYLKKAGGKQTAKAGTDVHTFTKN
jgi:hypothetical protein